MERQEKEWRGKGGGRPSLARIPAGAYGDLFTPLRGRTLVLS